MHVIVHPEEPAVSYQPTYAYPAPHPYAPAPSTGLAVASLVLGILAIAGCLVPLLNLVSVVLALVSIVLGIVALSGVRRGRTGGKGLAVAGIVLSTLSIIGAVVVSTLVVNLVDTAVDELQTAATDALAAQVAQFPGQTVHDVVASASGTVVLNDVSVTATPLVAQADATGPFVCTTVTVVSSSASPLPVSPSDWSVQQPNGALRTPGAFGPTDLQPGELAPSGTVTGDICFAGVADPGTYVLLHDAGTAATGSIQPERGAWISTL